MATSVRHDFHSDLALSIANEIQFQKSNYYYFLGKVESWGSVDRASIDIRPDSDEENNLIRTNAVYVKKITANDVSIVTTRYDWVAGTIFAIWNHTKNMKNKNFYCLTDLNHVYKCLDNNSGAASTVKPNEKSFTVFRTADGYLWKYMFTIPSFKRSRFTSLRYIPVQRALSNSFYNKGSVDHIFVTDGGSGYTDVLLTTISVTGGTTTGSGAAGKITVGNIGQIIGVSITNGGSGYTKGVAVSFNTINGYNGKGTATIVGGVVTGVVINTPGVNYVNGQSIVFSVGGAAFIAVVSRETGSLENVIIKNAGTGYVTKPNLTVLADNGVGKYNNPFAVVKAIEYQGSIVRVIIEDPGINYPADFNTSILVQGDGTGAVFTPIIDNGSVVGVIIENPGEGYTVLNLTVIGAGIGAKLNSIISGSDFTADQSIVEQTTIEGAIYAAVMVGGGNNYSSATTASIVGDGTGATATVAISSDGSIKGVTMTNYGSNYTYANIRFTDINRGISLPIVDATAYPTLPPIGGHGYNAINELYGDTLAVVSSLRQDTQLNNILQDYRQFGLLKNPSNINTGKLITEGSSLLTYECVFATVAGLIIDEVLMISNVKFRVVFVDGVKVTLQQLGINYISPIGILSAFTEPSRTYMSNLINSSPTVNKYSGSLLYVSEENPFSFTNEQGIVIKTFLKF